MSKFAVKVGVASTMMLAGIGCGLVQQDGPEACTPGVRDCPCAVEGCVGDLVCAGGLCVAEDSGATDGGMPTDPTSDGDGTGAPTGSSDGSGPRIIDFGTNRTRLTEGEMVTFAVTVIDPDGPEDIQGGALKTEDGAVSYAAFADVGDGTFEAVISWADLDGVEPIEFEDTQTRVFRIDMFDNSGNRDTQMMEIELYCEPGLGVRACDGSCVSLVDDSENCGACAVACDEGDACAAGSCAHAWSECLVQGQTEATSCAEYCASVGEACVVECDAAGYSVAVWFEGACDGYPDQVASFLGACESPPPEGAASARCCCSVGAAFP